MAAHDVHSFVQKFLNLCNEGKTAHLNLECCAGKAFINLRLDLDVYPPQSYAPQQPPPPHCISCSPSRRRRTVRCAQAQAYSIRNDSNSPATEQVSEDASSTAEKAATNYATNNLRTDVCNLPGPAEQAVPDVILDPPLAPQLLPQQEHDAYTAGEADIPKDNNNAEKATELIENKSVENSAKNNDSVILFVTFVTKNLKLKI